MSLFRQPPVWSPLSLRALLSGFWTAWLTNGRAARRALDAALRDAYGPKELYLTDSGTSALTLALQVAHETTHAPIALPAYCCFDVATAADGAGVPFFLYDIQPGTLSPDLPSLRRAFEAGARSVVVAHLYGVPVDLASVQALAGEFAALIIEDAAQGSGCEWRGKPAGAHGALGVLSFGRGKGLTGGKGGGVLVNDERLRAAAAVAWDSTTGPKEPRGSFKDYLLLNAQWLFGPPSLYWIPASLPFLGLGETTYRAPTPVGGMTALAVGVLARTLQLAPAEAAARRVNASMLRAEVVGASHVRPVPEWEAGWLRCPVVLQRTADEILTPYLVAAGVLRGYPSPLSALPGFGERRLNPGDDFPGASLLAERLVTLPTHRFVQSARIPVFCL